jgi:adenylosuccinate synthase
LNPPEIKGNVVYEGAQGVLLDESRGFRPHTTWTNTTFDNALEMLKGEDYEVVKIGVLRTYFTRHGAGPFVGESPLVNFDDHNVEGRWQGKFRQGFFDAVAARYAIEACGGIDCLALTHLDTVIKYNDQNFVGVAAYEMNGRVVEEIDFATSTADLMACRPILDHRSATSAKSWIEDSLGVEVCYESSGQTYKEKRYLVAAAEILKITPEQMRRLRRRDARAANFGMTYGLGSNERSQK